MVCIIAQGSYLCDSRRKQLDLGRFLEQAKRTSHSCPSKPAYAQWSGYVSHSALHSSQPDKDGAQFAWKKRELSAPMEDLTSEQPVMLQRMSGISFSAGCDAERDAADSRCFEVQAGRFLVGHSIVLNEGLAGSSDSMPSAPGGPMAAVDNKTKQDDEEEWPPLPGTKKPPIPFPRASQEFKAPSAVQVTGPVITKPPVRFPAPIAAPVARTHSQATVPNNISSLLASTPTTAPAPSAPSAVRSEVQTLASQNKQKAVHLDACGQFFQAAQLRAEAATIEVCSQ